ncbi:MULTISPECIES: hypothetical protein [unclassified Nocardia]|uniref:hypothetical protein n=1 Tax=unclassified Nocardia TaxID=2637762 RepID=UPI001CE3CC8E|nr:MULTISPECIES: hypothetical protein [unclassified Nocardia]
MTGVRAVFGDIVEVFRGFGRGLLDGHSALISDCWQEGQDSSAHKEPCVAAELVG